MARVSFRLRRDTAVGGDTIGVGSFARGSSDAQIAAGSTFVDNDRTLRAKDFIIAFDTDIESTFSAIAIDYGVTEIEWSLSEVPVPVVDVALNQSALVGIRVVYNSWGYPEAANDGIIVYDEVATVDDVVNIGRLTIQHPANDNRTWRYYSLFGRYYNNDSGSTGTYWYERLASVETLIPYNFDSTSLLWNRIPVYYREQDTSGDLYKFLNIFGFELDRTRTLIEAVMTSSDPSLAEAETVEQLANFVGLEVNVDDIGVARTRALLQDIGYLRKQKGTYNGIVGYLKALSGANVDFELVAGNYRATIYAQRANLIGDPRLVGTVGSTWDVVNSGSTITRSNSTGKVVITNTGATNAKVALVSKVGIPIGAGVSYFMSAKFEGIPVNNLTFYGGKLNTNTTTITYPTATVNPVGYVGNRPVLELNMTGVTTGTYYPIMFFKLSAGESVTVSNWMLEPYKYGEYFDGSSDFGGFLYQSNFNDYAWSGAPSVNNSYSTFTVQRKKMETAIKKVCASIMPVNIAFNPQSTTNLRFDWVPGKT